MTKLQVAEGGSTNRVEVQVARMVVLMVLAFLLTWLPYASMAIAVVMDSTLYIDPITATIPVYLAKSSTVYNPIIYIFMNRQVTSPLINTEFKERKISDSQELRICLFVSAVPRICHQHRPMWTAGLGLQPADVRGGDYSHFCQQEPEDLTQRI